MSRMLRVFILAGGIVTSGVFLMSYITPSENDMRERLGFPKGMGPVEVKEKNVEIMAVLKREAGLSTDSKKS